MRHICPGWCHRCPEMVAAVKARGGDTTDPLETTMPMCDGGVWYGLPGCCCPSKRERERHANERQRRIDEMRTLISVYPVAARVAVAELESRP